MNDDYIMVFERSDGIRYHFKLINLEKAYDDLKEYEYEEFISSVGNVLLFDNRNKSVDCIAVLNNMRKLNEVKNNE